MKWTMSRCSKCTVGVLTWLLVTVSTAQAGWKPHPDFGLSELENFAVFLLGQPAEVQEVTAKLDLSLVTIYGDVAVGPNSILDFQGAATIYGDLYLDSTVTRILTNVGTVNGGRYTQDLSSQASRAMAVSAYWRELPPAQTYATLATSTTIQGVSGMNVIHIKNLDYAVEPGAQLTLEGPPDALFLLNISGKLEMGKGSSIRSTDPARVLVNVLPGLSAVRMDAGSHIGGTLLAVDRKMGPMAGTTGALIGAQLKEISLINGAAVNPPDPSLFPVAAIAAQAVAAVHETVTLDGSVSTTPDPQRELTYRWSILSKPSGSAAEIDDSAAAITFFTPDVPGDYFVELVVDNILMSSDPARFRITAAVTGMESDLALKIVAPKTVYLSDPLTVTLTVKNLGPGSADSANLKATLLGRTSSILIDNPACTVAVGVVECPLDTLAPGGSQSVRIDLQPAKVSNFDILATTSAPGSLDPDLSNNEASSRTKVLSLSQ